MKKIFPFLTLLFLMSACNQVPPNVAESRPEPAAGIESISSEGWTIYENTQYGLRLERPTEWEFSAGLGYGDMFVLSTYQGFVGDDYASCDIEEGLGVELDLLAKDSTQSFEDLAESMNEDSIGMLNGELTSLEINGQKAFRSEKSGAETVCASYGYIIEQDTDSYARLYLWGNPAHPEFEKLDTIVQSIELF